ncbi:hypothetical protein AVEN_47603-1 [Araneus ventricosus]|uniref:Uncharacterized protein n=1 Tax=Araneus ventricosus TaxID=182803 RepID=A0A4Y2DNJ8_ARAVE|nr:hypothetical protein AVEN_47603-1 [Araneus ventricosus]
MTYWYRVGGFQIRNPIPLKIRRVLDLLHVKSYVGGKRPPAVVVQHNPPRRSLPYWFKALKSRRGRETTSCSKRTQAFIKMFSSYLHTTPLNMGGN